MRNIALLLALLLPLLLAGLPYAPARAAQEGNPATIEGIHVRRIGKVPYAREAAETAVRQFEAQCADLGRICTMLPAGASAQDSAACAAVTRRFQLTGSVADIGNQRTDEYFLPERRWVARKVRTSNLHVKSLCEVEVVEQEKIDIRHYSTRGYTRFVSKEEPGKGRSWLRSEHEPLDPRAAALLAGLFPMADASQVSPPRGSRTYAQHACELREVSGPWSASLCVTSTGIPFPSHIALATKVTAPATEGRTTLLEDQVEALALGVTLPLELFLPPAGEPVQDARTLARSSGSRNATQRWCAREQARTGVNPCEEDARDDED